MRRLRQLIFRTLTLGKRRLRVVRGVDVRACSKLLTTGGRICKAVDKGWVVEAVFVWWLEEIGG